MRDWRAFTMGAGVGAAYWPGLLAASFVPRWAFIAVGVPALMKIDPRALGEGMRWLLVFLLGLGALSLMRSPWVNAGIGDLIFIIVLCGVCVAGANLETLDDVMIGLGAGLAVSSVLAVPQFFDWWRPVTEIQPPSGLFYSSEVLGEFAGLVLAWAVTRPNWTIAVIAAVPVALTQSRIGLFVAVIAALYAWRPNWRILLPLVAALFVGACWMLLFGKFAAADHTMHRIVLWGATLLAFTPLGNGLGWGSAAFPIEEFCHSDALQAMAELGVGALALTLIPITAFRSKRGHRAERALFLAACIEVCVSFPLHFPASGFLAAVVAGFLVGAGPLVRVGEPHRTADDEHRRLWRRNAGGADALSRGRGSLAFPLRSVSAWIASLRAREHRTTAIA